MRNWGSESPSQDQPGSVSRQSLCSQQMLFSHPLTPCYIILMFQDQINWGSIVSVSAESLQSCRTFCSPLKCSPPRSSVHGILQARILEWVAISFSQGSSRPRDWTQIPHFAGRRFNLWATREALPNTDTWFLPLPLLTEKLGNVRALVGAVAGQCQSVHSRHYKLMHSVLFYQCSL